MVTAVRTRKNSGERNEGAEDGEVGGDSPEACTGWPSGAFSPASRCSYRQRDASKVALIALVEALRAGGGRLLDVQWLTPHLASLGAVDVSRRRYHGC